MRIDIRPVPHDALANLTATPMVKAIRLAWTLPTNGTGYQSAQVWSSTVNDLESASLVSVAGGNSFTHAVNDNATRYYWIRAVDQYNRAVGAFTGPISATANRELEEAIANIGSDNVLSKGEKSLVNKEWSAINQKAAQLEIQADAMGVSRTLFSQRFSELNTYLGSLSPAWNDSSVDTIIDGPTFRAKFVEYYKEEQKLTNALTTSAAPASGRGAAINEDPMIEKPEAWVVVSGNVQRASAGGMPGVMGAMCYVVDPANGGTWLDAKVSSRKRHAIDPRRVYNLSANIYAANGNNRHMYVYVNFYTTETGGTAHPGQGTGGTGWGGSMSGYVFGSFPPAGQWTRQGANFGPGTGKEIPATARYVEIGVWFHYSGEGSGSTADQAAQDIRLIDVTEAQAAKTAADTAQTTANTAKAGADAANAVIADISSDNKLTKGEKPAELVRWKTIYDEYPGIDAQAAAFSIGNSRTNYQNYFGALQAYIGSLEPQFSTIPGDDITIVGTSYRTKFADYFYYRQILLNEIANEASKRASWASVTGSGKPADNATSDLKLVGWNSVVVTGNRAVKSGGANAWDSQVASDDGFAGGAYVTARMDNLCIVMFGLNTDPHVDASFGSIDFAVYPYLDGNIQAYASGINQGNIGTYAVGDILGVSYDGSKVYYTKNGVVLFTYTPSRITAPLYLDSSFYSPGAALSNIRFGPLTSNHWDALGNRPDSDIRNNLIDLKDWRKGTRPGWPVNSEGNAIFPCAPAGTPDLTSSIPGPKGGSDLVWYAQEQSNNGEAGGGWDAPNTLQLDPTRTYRFVIPIRRLTGSGESYWGVQSNTVCDLNTTTTNGNPYFASASAAWIQPGKWFLFVGFVFPAGSTGNTHEGAGIYDCTTGALIVQGANFCFRADQNGLTGHRAYQYYASNLAEQIFGRPMVNLVDGSEPSLREFFATSAMLNSEQKWAQVSGPGKPADNATVGAPNGTYVGDKLAETVAGAVGQVSNSKSVSGLYDVTGMNNQPNSTLITVVTFTASTSGMTAPVSYSWSVQKDQGTYLGLTATSGSQVSVQAKGKDNRASGTVTCTATDAKGFTAVAQAYIDVGFGTGTAV